MKEHLVKSTIEADIATAWSLGATKTPLVGIIDELEALEFLGDDDLAVKQATLDLIAPRGRDPDHMRATVEWAVDLGRTVTDLPLSAQAKPNPQ